jgi:hypothetical protein
MSGVKLFPFFNVQMPPGNVFGVDETVVPELVLSPSAEQGYYSSCGRCVPVLTRSSGSRRDARQGSPGHHVPSHGGRRRPERLSGLGKVGNSEALPTSCLNNRINSDCQLRCAPLAAGYASR